MEERNGVIIDGVVYLTKTNITHKHRCSLRELDCCDGEKCTIQFVLISAHQMSIS